MSAVTGAGVFPDEGKIGELVEQMRLRYAHAQQLKQLPSQQQTPATSQQVATDSIGMLILPLKSIVHNDGRLTCSPLSFR